MRGTLSNLNNVKASPSPVVVNPELCVFPKSSHHPKQGDVREGGGVLLIPAGR